MVVRPASVDLQEGDETECQQEMGLDLGEWGQ